MTDTVLVTGASGFIGHHLVRALRQRQARVLCLVRPTSKVDELERMGATLVVGDVTDYDTLVDPVAESSVVYHLAGLSTAHTAEELLRVNEGGARNVTRACAQALESPALILLSSLAAAGPSTDGSPLSEDDPPHPISNYGRSKLAGERAVAGYADRVPVTIVRAGIVFGEGDRDVYKMFAWVEKGLHLIPVDGRTRHSLIHASDCAAIMIEAAERGERLKPPGGGGQGIYYAAYDRHPSYPELQELIATALDRKRLLRVQIPKRLVLLIAAVLQAGASLLGRTPSIINLDKAREGFAGSWICSPAKAGTQLGFSPAVDLPGRLRQTAHWYRQHGWL